MRTKHMLAKHTYIEDLVRDYPEVVRPLAEKGLICIACGEPVWGTLGELAESKSISNIDTIIEELNSIITKKREGITS